MPNKKYLGYKAEDLTMPYAKYYNENVAPAALHALEGLAASPFDAGKIPPLEAITKLHEAGYTEIETGYTLENDGSARVAVLTSMPNVTPEMWHWWFGWHGCRDNRYKLWHPKAHLSAVWQDGRDDLAYIGRTSMIQEYIGTKLEKANIRFISPTELGFSENDILDKSKVVYICARLGYTNFPLDFGYLVHQIRATENGAEMRSRFFMGGKYIAFRSDSIFAKSVSKILQKVKKIDAQQAENLLLHCSEEMAHLAKILPELYNAFKEKNQ